VPVTAGQTTSFSQTEPPVPPSFLVSGTGIVTQMGEIWIIAGQQFIVTDSTQISGNPQIGDRVHVEGSLNNEGIPVADTIYKLAAGAIDEFSLTGIVEEMQAETWLVSGQMISISLQTEIEPNVQIGDTVQVIGTIQQPDGVLIASQIQIVATAEGLPFEFTGIVQSIGASEWIISGITIAINEETALAADIGLGDTVKVEGLILADDTWLALEISLVAQDQAVFSFTGEVMSMTPWLVAGITFDVAEWTLIEPGIEVGDRVRVEGVILADGSWLAAEITLLSTDILQITFVGEVTSINPWVINGLPIQINDDTVIEGDISVGDLVQVTVWIRNDGTWLASHIKLLAVETGAGCVWLTAVVNSINDSQIILANGQTIILDENLIVEGELRPGSVILIVACVLTDGTIDIISITVIFTPPPPPPPAAPPPPNGNPGNPGGNTTICHKPGTPAEQTKTIPNSALGGHLGHGDTLGACGR
jgi:hypothetical protein